MKKFKRHSIMVLCLVCMMLSCALASSNIAVYEDVFPTEQLLSGQLDQALIIGDSISGLLNDGNGTIVFESAGSYSGEFNNSKRDGHGVFVWADGTVYDGMWQADMMSGKGTMTLANGTEYSGTFVKNKFTQGRVTIPQKKGAVLYCTVKNGKLSQDVTLKLADGTSATGKIPSGKTQFSGNVTIKYTNGDKYVGTLKDGYKSGQGTYTWSNGAHYVGKWQNDKMHGAGTYYYSKSEKYSYLKGNFVSNELEGNATYVDSSGNRYQTTWKNNVCKTVKK